MERKEYNITYMLPRWRITLARIEGFHLELKCTACQHAHIIEARSLYPRCFPADRLDAIARRCRCGACGRLGWVRWEIMAEFEEPPW